MRKWVASVGIPTIFALILLACGGDDTTLPPPSSAAVDSTTMPAEADDERSGPAPGRDADARQYGEPVVPGLDLVVVLTPVSDPGPHPLLSWEPVADARWYSTVVLASDGSVYWGWFGEDTQIHLGGPLEMEPHARGPRLAPGMSWSVVALDESLDPIAASELHALSG